MSSRFAIHLGAHKTATTHIQNCLTRHAPRLRQAGIAYIGPRELRDGTLELPGALEQGVGGFGRRRAFRRALAAHAGAAGRILISEENILGVAHDPRMIRECRFYPRGHVRVSRLLRTIGAEGATLFLALRDPASYLVSAYSQRLFSGRVESFEEFIDGADPVRMRWSDLVARLLEAQPGVRLVVWCYEELRPPAEGLFDRMLPGVPRGAVTLAPGVTHPGLSARAHAAIMAHYRRAGVRTGREVVLEARRRFPKTGDEPAFEPFPAGIRAASAAAYRDDIARIAATSGVTMLSP